MYQRGVSWEGHFPSLRGTRREGEAKQTQEQFCHEHLKKCIANRCASRTGLHHKPALHLELLRACRTLRPHPGDISCSPGGTAEPGCIISLYPCRNQRAHVAAAAARIPHPHNGIRCAPPCAAWLHSLLPCISLAVGKSGCRAIAHRGRRSYPALWSSETRDLM